MIKYTTLNLNDYTTIIIFMDIYIYGYDVVYIDSITVFI